MSRHLRSVLICLLGAIAMAGLVASTTEDLGPLAAIATPGWLQVPGIIGIGFLVGLASRSAGAAIISLLVISISAALLQGAAIALPGLELERAATHLVNRGTVQGFYALILVLFIGLVGVVAAMLVNVFVRRIDI